MMDLIVAGIVAIIVGLAIAYIVKAKKDGVKCIGCSVAGKKPKSASAASSCGGGCAGCGGSCHCNVE